MSLGSRPLLALLAIAFCASLGAGGVQSSSGLAQGKSKATPRESIETLAEEAARDLSRRDYAAAAKKYERLAELQPRSANVLNNLAVAYHMAGRGREAIPVLRKALRLDPNLFSANLFLGIELIQMNQPEEAISSLEKAISLDGTNRDALLALASAHYATKRFDLAAKTYQRQTALQPQDADAWFGLGFCFEQIGHAGTRQMGEIEPNSPFTQKLTGEFMLEQDAIVDAEEAYRRALAADDSLEGIRAALGFVHLRLGEFSQAEQEFKLAAEKDAGSLDSKLGLAAVALEREDFANAARLLCEVHATDEGFFHARLDFFLAALREQTQSKTIESLSADPSQEECTKAIGLLKRELTLPESSIHLDQAFEPLTPRSASGPADVDAARAAVEAGRYSECARRLRGSLPAAPKDLLLLARCACLSGQFYIAFEAAQSVLVKEPRSMEAHFWQVEAGRKLAQASFQRAIQLKPDSWQGHLLLGDIYRQRKKWDVARSHYEAVTRLKPNNPGAFLGMATIHWQTGDNALAEATLKKALEIVPDNPTANFMLGDVYLRMRRFEEAIPYLQKHVALGGGMLTAHGNLGKAYAALRRDQEAITELLKALPTDRFGELHYQLSVLYKRQGQTELAKQALAKSEELKKKARESQRERIERAVSAGENASPAQP